MTTAFATMALAALTLAAGAIGAPARPSGTLQLEAQFHLKWSNVACPPGTSPSNGCFLFAGNGTAPGLGLATVTYTLLDDEPVPGCHQFDFTPVAIAVAGKGQIDAKLVDPKIKCLVAPNPFGTFIANFTGGSGAYANASGSGSVEIQIIGSDSGVSIDSWTGMLTVPGLEFDLIPPIFSGAVSKTDRVPNGAKRIRVRYTVTARDAIDGSVPATCKPKSGSFFKVGRTNVTCSATDSSGNTGRARFTVTVKRSLE